MADPGLDRLTSCCRAGTGKHLVAWNSALIYNIISSQSVHDEFQGLQMPSLLLIGTADSTVIGADIAPPAVKARIGHYQELGNQVRPLDPDRVPGAGSRTADGATRTRSPGPAGLVEATLTQEPEHDAADCGNR